MSVVVSNALSQGILADMQSTSSVIDGCLEELSKQEGLLKQLESSCRTQAQRVNEAIALFNKTEVPLSNQVLYGNNEWSRTWPLIEKINELLELPKPNYVNWIRNRSKGLPHPTPFPSTNRPAYLNQNLIQDPIKTSKALVTGVLKKEIRGIQDPQVKIQVLMKQIADLQQEAQQLLSKIVARIESDQKETKTLDQKIIDMRSRVTTLYQSAKQKRSAVVGELQSAEARYRTFLTKLAKK